MDFANEATFWTAALHEAAHIAAARLLRVPIVEVSLKGKLATYIRVEYNHAFQVWFIQLFPWLFDLLFGLHYFKGYFRVMWLKVWFRSRFRFARCVLSEFRD